MKRTISKMLLMAALTLSANAAHAQLSEILSKATSAISSATGDNNTINSLVGVISSKLIPTEDQIVGTWQYQEPAVMFTSSNVLKSTAGSVASKTIETKLQSYLSKVGIKKNKMSVTFSKDKTFTVKRSNKTVASGTYTISGSEVTLTFKGRSNPAKLTPQLDNGSLVIVTDATKFKTFLEGIGSKVSGLSTITSLSKSMDGMKLGIRLSK